MTDSITNLVILGSTGSIGRQTLDVVRALPERFRIIGLAAGENTALLKEQMEEFKPQYYYHSAKKGQTKSPKLRYISMEDMAALPGVDIVVSGRWQKEKEPRLTNLVEELQKLITDAGIGSIASPHEQNISDT